MATIGTYLRIHGRLVRDCPAEEIKWVRVQGDLTSSGAAVDAAARLRSACGTARRLIVDAAGVEDVDTKFVAVLVDLRRRAKARRCDVLILPSAAVRRWLKICRLDVLLR